MSTPDPTLPVRPLYTLAFDASWCRFELRLNDLPVLAFDASTSTVDSARNVKTPPAPPCRSRTLRRGASPR